MRRPRLFQPPVRVYARMPIQAFEDRDNFVTNQVTLADYDPEGETARERIFSAPVLPSGSALDSPVVTLAEIKHWLRIDAVDTAEDELLLSLEAAAHIHVENWLRQEIDATVGENIKSAMLLAIAHWYRNREAVGDALSELPLAFSALLAPERDYSAGY